MLSVSRCPPSSSSASSSTSTPWLSWVHSYSFLFHQAVHWHHSHQWGLVKFGFAIHHTISRWHLNPNCLVNLSDKAASKDISLFHWKFSPNPKLLALKVGSNFEKKLDGEGAVKKKDTAVILRFRFWNWISVEETWLVRRWFNFRT